MSITNLKLLLVALLLTFSTTVTYADKTVADLDGKDKDRYEMFRHLFLNGTPEEFYSFANDYAKELHQKGYMMLYYKLLCNKGFFALRHNQIYRAIQYAQALKRSGRTKPATTTISPQDSMATSTAAATTRPVGRPTSNRLSRRWATVTRSSRCASICAWQRCLA